MKLFQQLLVAPAALGMLSPIAATAAELNIDGVSDYSDSIGQVQSISQFSDVYPTDWAYQALTALAERHGCVAASPNGSMTRYEAAALLNKCLGEVAQVNDEERRLLNEFGPELAVIKGRIDGLEARVGEFEAGQFSATTKLSGKTQFVSGFVDYDSVVYDTSKEGLTFSYSTQWDLNTSFNGRDRLYTRVKTGNFNDGGPFDDTAHGTYLAAAKDSGNTIKVDKLWYEFPVGDNWKFWVGPEIESYYMLASAPSIYKPILKGFALGGNGAAYGSSTSQGVGAAWIQSVSDRSQPRFAISTNYTAKSGELANTGTGGGMFTDNVNQWMTKVEYGSPRWQVSLAVNQRSCEVSASNSKTCWDGGSYYSTTKGKNRTGESTGYGLRAYWKPETTGAIPSVQVGYDWATVDDDAATGSTEATAAWMVGLTWKDAFIDGNQAGVAFGQRQYATEIVGGAADGGEDNFIWEVYYDFKVSDNITVTPAIFGGNDTKDGNCSGPSGSCDDFFGGLVQTTFKF